MAADIPPGRLAYRAAFAERLRSLRMEQGLTQKQLWTLADIAPSYYSGIERGVHNPSLDHILRLADALRVQPRALLPDRPLRAARPRPK